MAYFKLIDKNGNTGAFGNSRLKQQGFVCVEITEDEYDELIAKHNELEKQVNKKSNVLP